MAYLSYIGLWFKYLDFMSFMPNHLIQNEEGNTTSFLQGFNIVNINNYVLNSGLAVFVFLTI